jgi:phage-related protein
MASRIAEAYVQIVPRIDGVGKNLTGALSGEMGEAGDKSGKGFAAGFKKVIGPAMAIAGVVAVANFVKGSIKAGEEAATSNARIQNIAESMNLFGSETDTVTQRLVDLANKQALATGVDQNAIKATQAKLLTFKEIARTADEAGGAFDRATAAAIDLAAAGFGSAESNAVQLGKALNDPVKGIAALTRSGVTFTEAEKEKIKVLVESGQTLEAQNLILEAIETQVGGTAEATANGSDKIKVAFSQLQETVGLALAPAFETLVAALLPFITTLGPILADVFVKLAPAFEAVAAALPAIGELIGALAPIFGLLIEVVAELVVAILPVLSELIKALLPVFKSLTPPIIQIVKAFLPLIPALLSIALALVPLIEIMLPILIDWLNFLIPIVVFVAEVLAVVLAGAIEFLVAILGGLIGFLPKVLEGFQTVFTNIANFMIKIANGIIGTVEGLVNFVIRGVNSMIDALNSLKFEIPDWVPLIGGQSFSLNLRKLNSVNLGRIPELAKGGYVDKPTTAIIGEAGPEVVTPLKDFERMMGLDSENGKTINYYAAPNQSIDSEQALFQAIRRAKVVAQW